MESRNPAHFYTIRQAEENDIDALVTLNNSEKQWVGTVDDSQLRNFLGSPYFFVIEEAEQKNVLGFLLAMRPDANYDSLNFLWFKERYSDFIYIDRIVIDKKNRRRGLATVVYNSLLVEDFPLVCEVSIVPLNQESVDFHEKSGFKEVGIFSPHPPKTVRMYMRGKA